MEKVDTMKTIVEARKKFAEMYIDLWKGKEFPSEESMPVLLYFATALGGEVGEFQNKVKKIVRNYWTKSLEPTEVEVLGIAEELVDIFIYVLEVCRGLDIDLEEQYWLKMQILEGRYRRGN